MMKLHEKTSPDGSPLSKELDDLLVELEAKGHRNARDLFVHLKDVHDGAARLERAIETLATLRYERLEEVEKQLWDIRVEIYDHLLPNHFRWMKLALERICDSIGLVTDEVSGET